MGIVTGSVNLIKNGVLSVGDLAIYCANITYQLLVSPKQVLHGTGTTNQNMSSFYPGFDLSFAWNQHMFKDYLGVTTLRLGDLVLSLFLCACVYVFYVFAFCFVKNTQEYRSVAITCYKKNKN